MILSEKQIEMYNNCVFLNESNNDKIEFAKMKSELLKLGFSATFNNACTAVVKKVGKEHIKSIKFDKFSTNSGNGLFQITANVVPGDSCYDEEAIILDAHNMLGNYLNKDPKLTTKFKFDGSSDDGPHIYVFRKE